MRVLKVSYQGREVVRTSLSGPSLLLGRSPVCDIIVRYGGIHPVHLLFEYVGSDEFKANQGEWSITDVAGTAGKESQVEKSGIGKGTILDEKPAKLGEFQFEWVEDRLTETQLQGGAIRDQVRQLASSNGLSVDGGVVLEVITIHPDRDKVVDIAHIDLERGNGFENRDLPPIEFDWNPKIKQTPVQVRVRDPQRAFQFFQKGIKIDPQETNGEKSVNLGKKDLLQVQWQLKDYYIRLVPRIETPPARVALISDPFYRYLAVALMLVLALISFMRSQVMEPAKVEEAPQPPRIARVQLPSESRSAAPVSATEKKVTEVVKPAPEPQKVQEVKKSSPMVGPAAPTTSGDKKQQDVALNVKVPKKDVNRVGLLGALKGSPTKNTVKADAVLNQGIVNPGVTGTSGRVLIPQSPSGTVGATTSQVDKNLSSAATKLAGGDKLSSGGRGTLVDSAVGGDFAIGYGGLQDGGVGKDAVEVVEGGLDKETVRRTLNQYKKEIKTCYERALVSKPRIKGRVVYQWTITPKGVTTSNRLLTTTVESPTLESCVLGVISSVRWPEAPNKTATIVKYPFEFQSKM